MLQAGRSRVRFLIGSLGVSIDLILPAALISMGSNQTLKEISSRGIFWEVKAAGV